MRKTDKCRTGKQMKENTDEDVEQVQKVGVGEVEGSENRTKVER